MHSTKTKQNGPRKVKCKQKKTSIENIARNLFKSFKNAFGFFGFRIDEDILKILYFVRLDHIIISDLWTGRKRLAQKQLLDFYYIFEVENTNLTLRNFLLFVFSSVFFLRYIPGYKAFLLRCKYEQSFYNKILL